jgi:hypothetical protein
MTPISADRDLLRRIEAALGERRTEVPVTRTTVGERLVAVELSGPEAGMGVAHRPAGESAGHGRRLLEVGLGPASR